MPEFAVKLTLKTRQMWWHCKTEAWANSRIFSWHNNNLIGHKVQECHQHYVGKATTRCISVCFVTIALEFSSISDDCSRKQVIWNDLQQVQQVAMAQRCVGSHNYIFDEAQNVRHTGKMVQIPSSIQLGLVISRQIKQPAVRYPKLLPVRQSS